MSINTSHHSLRNGSVEPRNGSLDRASIKSAEKFVQAMSINEILTCKLEGDMLFYEIKWANSWIDEKMLKEIFDCASTLIDAFSSTKYDKNENKKFNQKSEAYHEQPRVEEMPIVKTIDEYEMNENEVESQDVSKGTLFMCDICSVAFYSHDSLSNHKLMCPGNEKSTLNSIPRQPAHPQQRQQQQRQRQRQQQMPRENQMARVETKNDNILTLLKDEYQTGNQTVTNMIMDMHNNSMFECENCHMTFADEDYLRRHKVRCKNHENSEFKCSICQRGFTTKGSLELHVNAVHLKKKDFGCSICGKLFSRKHILKLHLATHYGERNFKCPTCGKTFVQKSNYSRHVRIHESKNFGYKCRYCGQAFTQNKHVQKHVLTFHPDKYAEST